MSEQRGRTRLLRVRVRERELAELRAAALAEGIWASELVREAIRLRVRQATAAKRARRDAAPGGAPT